MSRFISYLNSCNCRLLSSKEELKKESEKKETKLVCKYNVTSTSEPTALRTNYEQNIFKSMEIDGVMLDELVTEYTFNSVGVHTVKYELYDDTSLGLHAPIFYNANLIEVIIPDSVTSIGTSAFVSCTGLVKVTMGKGVINIDASAFGGCSSLASINIPDSVTSIGANAFTGCITLTSVNIPDSVTSIGANAFGGCITLTSVNIPDSVTSIGANAFGGCSGLTSINIPSGVTRIGHGAFSDCSSLESVTVNATMPPVLDLNAFVYNANGRKIYVPTESVEAYKSAENWSTYADSIFPIE